MSWTCSHGYTYSDFEMECGMSFATMDYLADVAEREYDLHHDQLREAELARAHVLGEDECPWPWYADAPLEVQEPEVLPSETVQ